MTTRLHAIDNEWPYPDVEGDNLRNAMLMQQWWDENQARWREFLSAPSQVDLFWDWLHEEDLLDGVIIPEWVLVQEERTR